MLAGYCVPVKGPPAPGPGPGDRVQPCITPGAVDRDFHARNRHAAAGPRPAEEPDRSRFHEAPPREEVGNAGRRHQRVDAHVGARDPRVRGLGTEVVARELLDAVERHGDGIDVRQPLDARHAVPTGHHEAQGSAVLRQQRLAVHRVDHQHVGAHRLGHGEAARVVVLGAAVDAAVGAAEHDLPRTRPHPGRLQQRGKRRAGPLGGRDALLQPRHRGVARRGLAAPVARTFERDAQGLGGQRPDLVEGQRARPLDLPADRQPPLRGVGRRDVEVDEQVVQAGRGYVVAQGLERHAAVARRERHFLLHVAADDRRTACLAHGTTL